VTGSNVALIGDAIHTVKPYFGLGVNSAFEDVVVLGQSLEAGNGDMQKSLKEYSSRRGKEAVALVELSRGWDMQGWKGACKFIIPIILDGIFGGLFPKLFRPNCLGWIQYPGRTFTQVRRRKRFDNTVQVMMLATALAAATTLAFMALKLAFVSLAPVAMSLFEGVAPLSASAGDAMGRIGSFLSARYG
jgi:kynurenine 3-monooxygenase